MGGHIPLHHDRLVRCVLSATLRTAVEVEEETTLTLTMLCHQESPLDRLCAHVIGFCPSRLVVIGREGLFLKSNLRSYWITIFGRSGNDDVVHHFGSDSYRSSRPLLCQGPPPARQQQKGDTAGGDDSKRQQQGARLCCALSRWQTRINMGRSRLCPTKSLRLQPARPSNSR
jgi:hypothetical protein